MVAIRYTASAPIPTVIDFYKRTTAQAHWVVQNDSGLNDPDFRTVIFSGREKGHFLMVIASRSDNLTKVSLAFQ